MSQKPTDEPRVLTDVRLESFGLDDYVAHADDYPFIVGGALCFKGFEYVRRELPRMTAAGFGWLASILAEMVAGDPWQEGVYAFKIVRAWEKDQAE